MSVGNVCSDKWTHLMVSDERFVIFSSQWARRASANSGELGYNAANALEVCCRELMKNPIFRSTPGRVRR